MNSYPNLFRPPQEFRELNLLQELKKNPVCSQRELSNKFGFALGVTNACLKKMIQKGWIRVKEVDHRRIGYYLTSKGEAEKAKLNHHLISWSLQHYSILREVIGQSLQEMSAQGVKRVAFYGVSQEMELAYLLIQGSGMTLVGIVEDAVRMNHTRLFGFELKDVSQIATLHPDAVFITSLAEQEERIVKVTKLVDPQTVRIWSLSGGQVGWNSRLVLPSHRQGNGEGGNGLPEWSQSRPSNHDKNISRKPRSVGGELQSS